MKQLQVSFEGRSVGTAFVEESVTGEGFGFRYDPSWLAIPGFPISVRLPLREAPWSARESHVFFANLLPEGPAREAITARLGLSPDNDVDLLIALGEDTAGALRFTTTGESRTTERHERRRITDDELTRWVQGDPALVATEERLPRLSLAGAQHKMGVVLDGGEYFIPASDEPSTHLLKFDALRFSHLAANEFLTTAFARHLGLPTVSMELDPRRERPFLVIERYDRVSGAQVHRLHQEDFCQILGHLPARKYEIEGGPGLQGIGESLRRHSSAPAADLLILLRWALVQALAANADGHGKNLSMVYTRQGLRLAPCYDLVCTGAYEHLDRRLAMAIAGQRDPDKLRLRHARDLAKSLGLRPRQGEAELLRLLDTAEDALDQALATLSAAVGFTPAAERVEPVIRKRIRAVGNNVRQDRGDG